MNCIRYVFLLFGLIAMVEPVAAASPADNAEKTWRVTVQPYIWALGNNVRIATDEYDRSALTGYFDALLNQYQYGFLWSTTAFKGAWGLYMDGHFVRLKASDRELGLPYDSDVRQMLFEGAVLYRFGDEAAYADLLAGVRYFRMKSNVEVALVGSFNDLFQWFEPIVGVRLGHALGKNGRWSCEVAGDVGGFDLGSDFTWQASATLTYQLSERRTLSIGYRHIDIEYLNLPRRYESEMSGPVIGFGFRF